MLSRNFHQMRPCFDPAPGGGGISAPTDIAGCVVWFDASDAGSITLAVNNVIVWNDKGTSGNNLSASIGSSFPTLVTSALNSKNVVRFARSSAQNMYHPGSANLLQGVAGWTILVVGKSIDVTNNQYFIGIGTTSDTSARATLATSGTTAGHHNTRVRRANADTAINVESSNVFGTGYGYFTAIMDYTNTTGTFRENGVQVGQNTSMFVSGVTPSDGGNLYIASLGGNVTLDGDLAEVVVYNTALSGTNLTDIETFLKNKWGL